MIHVILLVIYKYYPIMDNMYLILIFIGLINYHLILKVTDKEIS